MYRPDAAPTPDQGHKNHTIKKRRRHERDTDRIKQDEYDEVADYMLDLGFEEGYVQELSSADEVYVPPFDLTGVE